MYIAIPLHHMNTQAQVYLIPCPLAPDALHTIPTYVLNAIKQCTVYYVENERTTRRYFKQLYKDMVIDDYSWHTIHKAEHAVLAQFKKDVLQGLSIGLVSEAGCPAIADPGSVLVQAAQELQATIHPLVGPSSILLALMGSGFTGQAFTFNGYLPIDAAERNTAIKALETKATQQLVTQLFIETPYRNNALLQSLLKSCAPTTKLCIAANLTAPNASIITKTIANWKLENLDYHKQPVIFILGK